MKQININLKLLLLVIFTIIAYLPALSGPFLYDDHSNLSTIYQLLTNINGILDNLFSSQSSSLGRPLSIITFLIQPITYPESALSYKIINLLIHCINGILVWLVTQAIARRYLPDAAKTPQNIATFTFITTAIWLFHPFMVSTSMYVIQRMTQLSFLFSMLAVLYYLTRPMETYTKYRSFVLDSIIIGFITLLGLLCKENAVLLFPIILILGLLDKQQMTNVHFKHWLLFYTLLPTLIIISIVGYYSTDASYQLLGFDYTAKERLFSQIFVIIEYIRNLLIPDISRYTILYENYPITPLSADSKALFGSLFITVFIALGVFSKTTIIRLGILWFLFWHLLESTTLPLLPYFEHRNYLPSIGLIWIISYILLKVKIQLKNKNLIGNSLIALPIAILFIQLIQLTIIWSNPKTLYKHWYQFNPESSLVQMSMFNMYINEQKYEAAYNFINRSEANKQQVKLPLILAKLSLECGSEIKLTDTLDKAIAMSIRPTLITKDVNAAHSALYQTIMTSPQKCLAQIPNLFQMSENILANAYQKDSKTFSRNILTDMAFLAIKVSDKKTALTYFERAFKHGKTEFIIPLVDINIELSNFDIANRWLQTLRKIEAGNKVTSKSFKNELIFLEQKLNAAMVD